MAKGKLGRTLRAAADEEDVVQSAFNSFVCAAQQGRFPRLHDRADLWQVLVTLTERKAINQRRKELAQKRGGGKLVARSAVRDAVAVAPEPSPELAAQMAEKLQVMLSKLANDQLRDIALAKLEYYTVQEIADRMGLSRRTVERRLNLIRRIWEEEDSDE